MRSTAPAAPGAILTKSSDRAQTRGGTSTGAITGCHENMHGDLLGRRARSGTSTGAIIDSHEGIRGDLIEGKGRGGGVGCGRLARLRATVRVAHFGTGMLEPFHTTPSQLVVRDCVRKLHNFDHWRAQEAKRARRPRSAMPQLWLLSPG